MFQISTLIHESHDIHTGVEEAKLAVVRQGARDHRDTGQLMLIAPVRRTPQDIPQQCGRVVKERVQHFWDTRKDLFDGAHNFDQCEDQ